jgi:rod shape-determining protein MreD
MVKPLKYWSVSALQIFNGCIIVGSVALCAFLQPLRLPGMSFLSASPNWFLIWVVTWSATRSPLKAIIAGIAVGWVQDALTAPSPTHALGLAIAGFLVSRFERFRLLEENFISGALLVFIMAMLVEGVMALQYLQQSSLQGRWIGLGFWQYLQQVALLSGILSSLWTPALYVPLNAWWASVHPLIERH